MCFTLSENNNDLRTQEAEEGRSQFEASLVYKASSRTARATQNNPLFWGLGGDKEKKIILVSLAFDIFNFDFWQRVDRILIHNLEGLEPHYIAKRSLSASLTFQILRL